MPPGLSAGNFCEKLLSRVKGLLAVLVTDRDGAVIVRAMSPSFSEQPDASFASAFSLSVEQANKMQWGKASAVTVYMDNRTIVHINLLPVVVALVGEPNVNVGLLLSLVPDIKTALSPIRDAIAADFYDESV